VPNLQKSHFPEPKCHSNSKRPNVTDRQSRALRTDWTNQNGIDTTNERGNELLVNDPAIDFIGLGKQIFQFCWFAQARGSIEKHHTALRFH
jgi:hypothetical protein